MHEFFIYNIFRAISCKKTQQNHTIMIHPKKEPTPMITTHQRMMILIAGPYRSGTGDDPAKMAANLRQLESVSYAIFQAGHVPMIGEWVALPIWRVAGGQAVGDALYEEILHPTARRLIERCDAVLRLPGASKGADEDVRQAQARGIPVYDDPAAIPHYQTSGV
jgi:hypothetical protein